jgi:hypothetical protein
MADSAPAPGSRSTGLGKMVQYPRDKFYVAKWGVFCHWKTLQSRSSDLKRFCLTVPNKPKNHTFLIKIITSLFLEFLLLLFMEFGPILILRVLKEWKIRSMKHLQS